VDVFPNDVHDAHVPSEAQLAKWRGSSDNPYEEKFFAVLAAMDEQIGRLLKAIDDNGLAENTIVILTSDNGPTDWPHYYKEGVNPPGFTGPFFGRKWCLYEGGIRMPFIIRWPGKVPAGKTNDSTVVAAIDILPSLAGLLGLELPEKVQVDGENMAPALLGREQQRDDPLFWEYGVYGSIEPGKPEHVSPQLAMRDGKWKLLMNPDHSDVKLFDLITDPGESENMAGKDPETTEVMQRQLATWWKEMAAYYEGY
jgi:arylsulfatase A-like enzyme